MNIHNPKGLKSLERAQKRLKFEELFFLQFHLLKMKLSRTKKLKGFEISTLGKSFNYLVPLALGGFSFFNHF